MTPQLAERVLFGALALFVLWVLAGHIIRMVRIERGIRRYQAHLDMFHGAFRQWCEDAKRAHADGKPLPPDPPFPPWRE